MLNKKPPKDLLQDLVLPRCLETGTPAMSATNRQLRIFVAAFMIGEGMTCLEAILAGEKLYTHAGSNLLERPGKLTVASIALEVIRLYNQK